MKKLARAFEDDLLEWNLGIEDDPKMVKVSVHIDGKFKEDLKALLVEFKDVFSWEYFDMKGIDPLLHQHKINLKIDAVLLIQQRYRMNPNFAKQVKQDLDKLL